MTMIDFTNHTTEVSRHLYYKNPKGEWEYCSVMWANGELAYYSPLLPRAHPIPPIPFRLANNSNRHWEYYMLDTGIRFVGEIKDLIREYSFDTVKYDQYQVIPSTQDNIRRLERLLADQFCLFDSDLEIHFSREREEKGDIRLAISERFQESVDELKELRKKSSNREESHDIDRAFLLKDFLDSR